MPRTRNPEAARIEADYKSKQKRTSRTANDTIKARLKSGESRRLIDSPEEVRGPSNYLYKTRQGAKQAAVAKSNSPKGETSSAPEGNRAAKGKGKKTATARKNPFKSVNPKQKAKALRDAKKKKTRKAPTYRG